MNENKIKKKKFLYLDKFENYRDTVEQKLKKIDKINKILMGLVLLIAGATLFIMLKY